MTRGPWYLDEGTYNFVTETIRHARRNGQDPATKLNDVKMLWTPAREQAIRIEAVEDLMGEFDVWRDPEFLRLVDRDGTGGTPAEMRRGIREWLTSYLAHLQG